MPIRRKCLPIEFQVQPTRRVRMYLQILEIFKGGLSFACQQFAKCSSADQVTLTFLIMLYANVCAASLFKVFSLV